MSGQYVWIVQKAFGKCDLKHGFAVRHSHIFMLPFFEQIFSRGVDWRDEDACRVNCWIDVGWGEFWARRRNGFDGQYRD